MTKILTVIAGVIAVIIIGGTVFGLWSVNNKSYQQKNNELSTKIDAAASEVQKIKNAKDDKGYVPKDVVTYFMNELRADSVDRAKLYLSESMQSVDVKKSVKIEKDLDKITVTETNESGGNDAWVVEIKGFIGEETNTFERIFNVIKEDGLWKISQIK